VWCGVVWCGLLDCQVVNGPEVLSKYVGQAEENIRNLFGEAEAEYKEKGDASVSLSVSTA
jgi:SpoVK/Ycf46/Vps4 family AAA+-type ATPase